jgi:hypothetical protein
MARATTLYPLTKANQALAFEYRLVELRQQAQASVSVDGYLAITRKTQEITSRLLSLLNSLDDAELLAWGAVLTRRNFGGPVL